MSLFIYFPKIYYNLLLDEQSVYGLDRSEVFVFDYDY